MNKVNQLIFAFILCSAFGVVAMEVPHGEVRVDVANASHQSCANITCALLASGCAIACNGATQAVLSRALERRFLMQAYGYTVTSTVTPFLLASPFCLAGMCCGFMAANICIEEGVRFCTGRGQSLPEWCDIKPAGAAKME